VSSDVRREDYWEQFAQTDQETAVSRPSLRKSTPGESGCSGPDHRSSLSQPLTERDGVKLRAECFDDDGPVTWRECVWRWRDAVKDNRDTWATLQDADGDQLDVRVEDRFTSQEWEKRYAKLCDLEEGLRNEYGRRLHTALVTITTSSSRADGSPRPPVDHLLDIEKSNDARTTALSRIFEGKRYERVALPEEHKSGYIHWHYAIFFDGELPPEAFQPVMDSHVANCPTAGEDAHEIRPDDPDGSAVVVRHVGGGKEDEGEISNLAAYLTNYTLGEGDEYEHDPLEAPEKRQMMLALLWATNKRYWRPSDGAQSHMSRSSDPTEEWELLGIKDGIDGELHEVTPGSGGVTMLETFKRSHPPPDRGGYPP
jgi:hypothetical protein